MTRYIFNFDVFLSLGYGVRGTSPHTNHQNQWVQVPNNEALLIRVIAILVQVLGENMIIKYVDPRGKTIPAMHAEFQVHDATTNRR